jgi:predicted dehydrogenase
MGGQMKFGIIGCGLIGNKRAAAISADKSLEIVSVADLIFDRAKTLSDKFGGKPSIDWQDVIKSDADIIIVAVYHDNLAAFTIEALKAGKNVLVEKPGARYPSELLPASKLAKEKNLKVKVGFNHRFHPTMLKAKELIDDNVLGELYYIRAWYGHGGRVGYENEWRFNKEISGGGELLDQGSHLIDLSQWFLGKFTKVQGVLQNFFWGGEVEDNCFILLSQDNGKTAHLHATWTEWKNYFHFEITGKDAKISINGLNGSYGIEQIALYKMLPQMGPPQTTIWQFPFTDKSWKAEIDELLNAIKQDRAVLGGIDDAIETLTITQSLYEQGGKI